MVAIFFVKSSVDKVKCQIFSFSSVIPFSFTRIWATSNSYTNQGSAIVDPTISGCIAVNVTTKIVVT